MNSTFGGASSSSSPPSGLFVVSEVGAEVLEKVKGVDPALKDNLRPEFVLPNVGRDGVLPIVNAVLVVLLLNRLVVLVGAPNLKAGVSFLLGESLDAIGLPNVKVLFVFSSVLAWLPKVNAVLVFA